MGTRNEDDVWTDKTIETPTLGSMLFREAIDDYLADLQDELRKGLSLCESIRKLDEKSST